jgi:hypothetical protein
MAKRDEAPYLDVLPAYQGVADLFFPAKEAVLSRTGNVATLCAIKAAAGADFVTVRSGDQRPNTRSESRKSAHILYRAKIRQRAREKNEARGDFFLTKRTIFDK